MQTNLVGCTVGLVCGAVVEPGHTALFSATVCEPLMVSRLRWATTYERPFAIEHMGLVLQQLKVGRMELGSSSMLSIDLTDRGVWRFPGERVLPGWSCAATVTNCHSEPLRLVSLTLWGRRLRSDEL